MLLFFLLLLARGCSTCLYAVQYREGQSSSNSCHSTAPPSQYTQHRHLTTTAAPFPQDRGQDASPRPRPRRLCRFWHETGNCRYGDQCQFLHGQRSRRMEVRAEPVRERVLEREGGKGEIEVVCWGMRAQRLPAGEWNIPLMMQRVIFACPLGQRCFLESRRYCPSAPSVGCSSCPTLCHSRSH